MVSRLTFTVGLWLRITALFVAMAAVAFFAMKPGYLMTTIVAVSFSIAIAVAIQLYIRRTNSELSRFLNAVRFADLSQSFALDHLGTGFSELGQALNESLQRLRGTRDETAREAQFVKAVMDHIPVALISIHDSNKIDLLNNAARRLFGVGARAGSVSSLEDLEAYGAAFAGDVARARPGERRRTYILMDDARQAITFSVTQVTTRAGTQRLISLENIQDELNATELAVWHDLVRVLTHEIMNSITPVASLSKTAADLLVDAQSDPARLADARDAIETVARRAQNLQGFVQSYRELTKLPPPRRRALKVNDLFERLRRLFQSEWPGVRLTVSLEPAELELFADPDLAEQALINVLRNAAQAAPGGTVTLVGRLSRLGRVVIEVGDNGPGVPAEVRTSIFLPFFTTKPEGSGVGLSLARQVMHAHGGDIVLCERDGGGALFRMTF